MVGREVGDLFPKTPAEIGEPVLEVDGLTRTGVFHDVSFEVRAGEIVGLAGLVGAGRSEVARAVFGVDSLRLRLGHAGRAQPRRSTSPACAIRRRHRVRPGGPPQAGPGHGGLGGPQHRRRGPRRARPRPACCRARDEGRAAGPWAARLEVKTSALDATAATMSGGNQQKVVLAKWLATDPQLLIIDEPTRGIDVGTKAEVHRLLSELAGQGMAILMISSELPEVLGMADRVLVSARAGSPPSIPRDEATPEAVMQRRHPDHQEAADERRPAPGPTEDAPSAEVERLVEPSSQSRGTRLFNTVVRSREMSILLVLLVVVAAATIKTPSFLSSANSWRDLLLTPSILLLLAVGQAVVVITRNVDLSVGSVLGLHRVPHRQAVHRPPRHPDRRGRAGRAAGSARSSGLVNGVLVAFGKVPALVITLGTLYIYRGIVLTWAGSDRINAGDMPEDFLALGTKSVLGDPGPVHAHPRSWSGVVGYYLHSHRGGRELYAIGSDPDAAVLYGLPVRRRVLARLRPQRRAGRPGRRRSTPPATAPSARAPAPASSCRRSPPWSSAASRSSAAAAPCGAPRSAPSCWSPSTGRCPILGIPDFWQRAVVGAPDPRRHRPRPGPLGPAGPQARRSEGRVMNTTTAHGTRRPGVPGVRPPAVAALALHPRDRGHRAAGGGLVLRARTTSCTSTGRSPSRSCSRT